jgi:F-type H+-transporting ATPase subunit epsilon
MAKTPILHCSVVTPERAVLECEAGFVAFPAHDGEVGVLPGRAPLVCKMGIGALRVQTGDASHVFVVDGGFAQVLNNRLTILAEQCRSAEELDAARVEKALADALAMKIPDDAAYAARSKAVQRARVQRRLLETAGR